MKSSGYGKDMSIYALEDYTVPRHVLDQPLTMARLASKRALITGGSRGIGAAITAAMAAEGAQVLTCGRGTRPAGLPITSSGKPLMSATRQMLMG